MPESGTRGMPSTEGGTVGAGYLLALGMRAAA